MSQAMSHGQVDLTHSGGTPPDPNDKSLTELLSAMTSDLSTLVRQELELAKVEAKEEASKAGKAAGMLAAGGVAAHMALLFVSIALAWAFDAFMPVGLAFLLVGVIYGVAALFLAKAGQARMKQVNPKPEQTIDTLKEDVQWARAQKS